MLPSPTAGLKQPSSNRDNSPQTNKDHLSHVDETGLAKETFKKTMLSRSKTCGLSSNQAPK